MPEKMGRFLISLFVIIYGLFIVGLILMNEWTLWLIPVAVLVFVVFKLNSKYTTAVLFIIGLLLRIVSIVIFHPVPIQDFGRMFDTAVALAGGKNTFAEYGYYYKVWAQQIPFVLWETFWLKIVNSAIFLESVHAVCGAASIYLLYRMVKPFVSERATGVAMILYILYPLFTAYPTVLSNQFAGAFFAVLAVWILFSRDTEKMSFIKYPLAGFILQISNLIRAEGIIVIVAILAVAVFTFPSKSQAIDVGKKRKTLVAGMVVMLLVYFVVNTAASKAIQASGICDNGFSSFMEWKFVCGLNPDTNGKYSVSDWEFLQDTFEDGYVTEDTRFLAKLLIKRNLSHPLKDYLIFVPSKINGMWNSTGSHWIIRDVPNNPDGSEAFLSVAVKKLDRAVFLVALFFTLFGLPFVKKNRTNEVVLIMYFVMFATAAAYLLLESQTRYVYLGELFMFATAAFGADSLINELSKRKAKKSLSAGSDGDN